MYKIGHPHTGEDHDTPGNTVSHIVFGCAGHEFKTPTGVMGVTNQPSLSVK